MVKKKTLKDILGFTGGQLSLGVGAGVIDKLPNGAIKVQGQAGIQNIGRFQPTIGTILGAKAVLRELKPLTKRKRKSRR